MIKNYNAFKTVNTTITYMIFILISLFVFYPLVYVVAAAFAPGNGIANMSIIPFGDGHTIHLANGMKITMGNGFTLDHFKYLITKTNYWLWFKNTFIIALSTSILTVIS